MKVSSLLPTARDLPIKFVDGEPTGIVMKIVGHDSKQVHEVGKKFAMQLSEDGKNFDLLEQRAAEVVAACVVGWTGLENEDGTPMPYSHEKAVELLSKPELSFIAEQVVRYAATRQNFFRRPESEA
jgi:hypothetical protein